MYCKQITLKSGQKRWVCVADGPRNTDGTRNQIERRGRTQREAKDKVNAEIERQKNAGSNYKLTKNITFEEVAKEWLKVYEATGVKYGSIRVRKKEIKILNKYLGNVPIKDITHHMYQQVLLALAKDGNNGKPYSENSIKNTSTCASMIFKYAIRNSLISVNPREGAVIPKKRMTVEELENKTISETYFESDELEEFLVATTRIGLELDLERFYTLAFSGMRPGELCALKKSDLDFKNNTIRISKTLTNEHGVMDDYKLETTKTNRIRVIEMDEKIMRILKRLVHINDKQKMKYRTLMDDYHDEDFVFRRPNGYPYMTSAVNNRMKRILRHTDIKKELTPHCFRHTHISMLTESGVDLPTIMDRVGHVDPETTLKVYTHVTNKMKSESVNKVANLHKNILDKMVF